jgi:DGQHR domain-containing protein
MIEVKVQRLNQGRGVRMFIGKMTAGDILKMWDVDRFVEEQEVFRGYQRQGVKERFREIADYVLKDSPLVVFPSSIVASVRKGEYVEESGILRIPEEKGSLWIADGQHRLGGFDTIKQYGKGRLISEASGEAVAKSLSFELPVTFIYLADRSEAEAEAIERAVFYLMNATAKPIRGSLKDILQWAIAEANLFWHPLLDKQDLRIKAVPIVFALHRDADSPLQGKINLADIRGLDRFASLRALVTSLERPGGLLREESFFELGVEQQKEYVKAYWRALNELFPLAFGEATRREWFILRNLTIQALMMLARDIFLSCKTDKGFDESKLKRMLAPLKDINFKREETSPFWGLGGEKGVMVAYHHLLNHLRTVGALP